MVCRRCTAAHRARGAAESRVRPPRSERRAPPQLYFLRWECSSCLILEATLAPGIKHKFVWQHALLSLTKACESMEPRAGLECSVCNKCCLLHCSEVDSRPCAALRRRVRFPDTLSTCPDVCVPCCPSAALDKRRLQLWLLLRCVLPSLALPLAAGPPAGRFPDVQRVSERLHSRVQGVTTRQAGLEHSSWAADTRATPSMRPKRLSPAACLAQD